MKLQKKIRLILLLLALLLSSGIKAQSVQYSIEKARVFIDDHKYEEAYKILQDINESQVNELGDSCLMLYNYEKGACLYFMDKYEEAIPYLKKALLKIEKMPHEDCNYLEIIYGIGSCYNHLEQYENAEKYFRRVIIRNKVEGYKCAIKTQTLRDLTELYKKLGYTKLAEACAEKITWEVENISANYFSHKMEMLLDLAESYEKQGKLDEEIDTYHKILDLIESNAGKGNEDYLTYSSILRYRLLLNNRIDDAIPILVDMIDIGKTYGIYNVDLCCAYEEYLEVMAERNNTEQVEKMISEAIKYFRHIPNYQPVRDIYLRIGDGFTTACNYKLGIYYFGKAKTETLQKSIRSLCNLGICYYHEQNDQKSLIYLKKAEEMINDSTDVVTRKVILSYLNTLYSRMKQYNDATKYAEIVAPYIKEIDGDNVYASHLVHWALCCSDLGQIEKSDSLFKEINELFPLLTDKTKIYYYSQYGFSEIKNGNYSHAVDLLTNGVALVQNTLEENHVWLPTMYHNLGRAYMLQHDYANALFYLNKSKDLQIQLNGNAMQRTLDYIKECETK